MIPRGHFGPRKNLQKELRAARWWGIIRHTPNPMKTPTLPPAKTAAISARILIEEAKGNDLFAAIDFILGAGTSAKVIDEIYHGLRGEAVPTP